MKSKHYIIIAGVLGTAFMAGSAGAQEAEAEKGFYVGLSGALAAVQDTDIAYYDAGGTFGGTGATDRVDGHAELKNAAQFAATIGYDFGVIRSDVEIAYSRNRISAIALDRLNGSAVTLTAADAADVCDYLEIAGCALSGNKISFSGGPKVRQLSALANVWADLPIGSVITPYAGGGLGIAGFELEGDGKARFAWQLGAGVHIAVSPHVGITVDYRHRQAQGATLPYDAVSGTTIGKIRTNSFGAGLRFTF
ncbi:hypothetical protein ASG11_14435 [Sphingomonas sp. Leaf357]|uniref:outer membrane protein n=1 Tax=Sphingomonas sp. Leaf357 TaxID=1736350 RepID=UPI00070239D7|nr:outer membrane beta-barrel protein [Sphingomonas sp. Leaf357]KQS02003.1 hypothetical protein ASG11_14435 [Sphingomonas sp. Leaf357]